MTASTAALITAPACDVDQHDPVYYWDTVQFKIDGYLFKLPRYHFIVGSDSFAARYLQVPRQGSPPVFVDAESENEVDRYDAWSTTSDIPSPGPKLQGDEVVELDGVTASEFRTFLKLLFPIHSKSTTIILSKDEWLTILTLSTLWNFKEFRKLAIEHLDPRITDPLELIQVGRRNFVPQWVVRGYEGLIRKKGAITEDESELIGYKTSVRLYIIRHDLASICPAQAESERDPEVDIDDMIRDQLALRFRDELDELETEAAHCRTAEEIEERKERDRIREEEEIRMLEEQQIREEKQRYLEQKRARRRAKKVAMDRLALEAHTLSQEAKTESLDLVKIPQGTDEGDEKPATSRQPDTTRSSDGIPRPRELALFDAEGEEGISIDVL